MSARGAALPAVLTLLAGAPALLAAGLGAQERPEPPPRRAVVVLAGPAGGESAVSRAEIEDGRNRAIARILAVLGDRAGEAGGETVRYSVYASAETKEAATGDGRWAHLEEDTGLLHIVVNREIRGDRLGLEWALLFNRALGPPSLPLLERGIAALHAPAWGGRGVRYWAARYHRAGLAPPLAELLRTPWSAEASPLLTAPLAGVLVEFLLARWSPTGFVERYAAWTPDAREIEGLEAGWSYHLDRVLAAHRSVIERERAEGGRARRRGLPPVLGFNYANEGYGRHAGYLSERSDGSIARIARTGASGIAVLPYATMPSATRPVALRAPVRAGSETDEAVVQAIRAATREGLTVLLKPHIWVRGSWPGAIAFRSRREWDRFFEAYGRWILHYAILAEMHGVPVFSVGVELSEATRGREEEWTAIVRRVRSVYSGSLVYAANWGAEFEEFGAWELFDYLGVDAYYPLAGDPEASDDELLRGAHAMLDRIEAVSLRSGRRVLFTEIGFASTRASWVRPWEGHLGAVPSVTDQLRSYRAVTEAMEGREWIAGVLWWEWPSDLRAAVRDRHGFTPAGKPAQALLGRWFRDGGPAGRALRAGRRQEAHEPPTS